VSSHPGFSDIELEFIDDLVSEFNEKADGYEYKLSKDVLDKISRYFDGQNES
jgi:hypothetical protein